MEVSATHLPCVITPTGQMATLSLRMILSVPQRGMLSPALASEYAYQLFTVKNAQAFNHGKLKDFTQVGVKAIDSKTLVVELENPTPYFLVAGPLQHLCRSPTYDFSFW